MTDVMTRLVAHAHHSTAQRCIGSRTAYKHVQLIRLCYLARTAAMLLSVCNADPGWRLSLVRRPMDF